MAPLEKLPKGEVNDIFDLNPLLSGVAVDEFDIETRVHPD
jgi:hypothetical protein